MIKYVNFYKNKLTIRNISLQNFLSLKHFSENNKTPPSEKTKQDEKDFLDFLVRNRQEIHENTKINEKKTKFEYLSTLGQMKFTIMGTLATGILLYRGILLKVKYL